MEVPNTAESEKVFNETFAEVKEALEAVGNCSSSTSGTEGDSHHKANECVRENN